MLSSQQSIRISNERLEKEADNHKREVLRMEAKCKHIVQTMEVRQVKLETELREKKKELQALLGDAEHSQHKEDLQMEIKELTEKTIVQGRIIQTQQKKIEVLKQGKEKFYEAKRREIMKDHSEQQGLRKENGRLREKLTEVTRERRQLRSQLEAFANTLGSSMDSHFG